MTDYTTPEILESYFVPALYQAAAGFSSTVSASLDDSGAQDCGGPPFKDCPGV